MKSAELSIHIKILSLLRFLLINTMMCKYFQIFNNDLIHYIINDIWGLKYDGNLAKVIADAGIPCSLMHNRKESDYTDYIQNVLEYFQIFNNDLIHYIISPFRISQPAILQFIY